MLCVALLTFHFSLLTSSCTDYFDTDPNNIINDGDYIDREDEIYKGMLGILGKVEGQSLALIGEREVGMDDITTVYAHIPLAEHA